MSQKRTLFESLRININETLGFHALGEVLDMRKDVMRNRSMASNEADKPCISQ